MKQLKEIACYVSDKVNIEDLIIADYISTDNMLPEKRGITVCLSKPEANRVTHYLPGDILVSNIRPYFKKIWFSKRTGGCSNDVIVFRAIDETETYPKFLYYLLAQDIFFEHMMSGSNGTKMPRGNKSLIPNFAFNNFGIDSQIRIANILSAYDDLIEKNEKQINLLEEAAMLLYKEWFVKLRFPGYENVNIVDGIPEGWEKGKIKDFYNTTSGGTPSRKKAEYFQDGDIPWLKTKELSDRYIIDTEEYITQKAVKESSAKIIDSDSVFVAMYGATIGKLGIASIKMACNQACCVLNARTANTSNEYIFYWLLNNRDFLVQQGKGAAQPNLSQEIIRDFSISIPEPKIMMQFSVFCNQLLQQSLILQKQILLLTEARDKLLPKLMSGEIEV